MTRRARMQAAVARMLTDPAFRERLWRATPADAPALGVEMDELDALLRLDRRALGVASEGYTGKRFERVAAAFPLTLAGLSLDPTARGRYLRETPFPATPADEIATFARHVRERDGLPPDHARWLGDLLAVETAAPPGTLAPMPGARPDPQRSRPLRRVPLVRLAGPLPGALAARGAPPRYPARETFALVLGHGTLEEVEADAVRLWESCDGIATTRELSALDPRAWERVERWSRIGAVTDARSLGEQP